jgi:hypothetical protein
MVVVIAGNVGSGAAFDFTDGVRKAIPVGFALSIGVPCSFHLIGGGRQAPKESVRKSSTVYFRRCDCAGDVVLRNRNFSGKPSLGQQSTAGGNNRAFDKRSAVHRNVRPNRARTYHHSIPEVKLFTQGKQRFGRDRNIQT